MTSEFPPPPRDRMIATAPGSPEALVFAEIAVKPERQRWMAAPGFSRGRWMARPAIRRVGWLRALLILFRASRQPRDEKAARLGDIERLILAGHNDAADRQIERLRADYPQVLMQAHAAALTSLNLYDRGAEESARVWHEVALICGTAHPAMIEIFGDTVPDRLAD